MTKHNRSGPQGSWEQPRQQPSAPQQSRPRPPLAPVGARAPQQVRGATRPQPPQPSPRQPSQPPPPTAPTTGLSVVSAVPRERSPRAGGDGDSGSIEGAASTGRSGQQAQESDVQTDITESHQDAAQRELQHDNAEVAQVHALLAVGAAIERLARAVEDSSKQT